MPPLRTHTLDSESDSEGDQALESTAAKLRRLKAELAEVEAEIQAGPSRLASSNAQTHTKRRTVLPARPPVDLAEELSALKLRLGNAEDTDLGQGVSFRPDEDEWTKRLERLKVANPIDGSKDGGIDDQEVGRTDGKQSDSTASDLDKRLARLEAALGSDEITVSIYLSPFWARDYKLTFSQTPLLPSLARSDHLLSLFTQPRHLDAISRRVKLLLVDLDRAATASRRNTHATPNLSSSPEKQSSSITLSQLEYNQLQQLFSVLPRLDPLLPILDPLLMRLKSLQTLHAEAGEMAEGLKRLQSEKRDQQEETGDMRRVVGEVQSGLTEAAGGIERNWKSLESRLSDLDTRIKALNT